MQSSAKTVDDYLAELPDDRRSELEKVRRVVLDRLPEGYEETMLYGMIAYVVPHSLYPAGYHCDPTKPLIYAALAAQKNYLSVYPMGVYDDAEAAKAFQDGFAERGKKLNMGKSCVRFKKADDLALDVVGDAIARLPVAAYLQGYEGFLASSKKR